MASRAPDAEGEWQDEGIALRHRRLAIVDLDARSHQPMVSTVGDLHKISDRADGISRRP
jgi:asparagine synthase (glutamine-hydrolysing)